MHGRRVFPSMGLLEDSFSACLSERLAGSGHHSGQRRHLALIGSCRLLKWAGSTDLQPHLHLLFPASAASIPYDIVLYGLYISVLRSVIVFSRNTFQSTFPQGRHQSGA